jgi:hypothetical protein
MHRTVRAYKLWAGSNFVTPLISYLFSPTINLSTAGELSTTVRMEVIKAIKINTIICDRLRGLVARVPGYRSRGPGSIPGTTRFSE